MTENGINCGPVRDREGSGITLLWRKETGWAVVRSSGFIDCVGTRAWAEHLVSMGISGRSLGYCQSMQKGSAVMLNNLCTASQIPTEIRRP
jgi:hypothetical protein